MNSRAKQVPQHPATEGKGQRGNAGSTEGCRLRLANKEPADWFSRVPGLLVTFGRQKVGRNRLKIDKTPQYPYPSPLRGAPLTYGSTSQQRPKKAHTECSSCCNKRSCHEVTEEIKNAHLSSRQSKATRDLKIPRTLSSTNFAIRNRNNKKPPCFIKQRRFLLLTKLYIT